MSFHTCFVARLTDSQPRSVELICRYDVKGSGVKAKDLPSIQSIGAFTFPLGPQHVSPKEYMAPEVKAILPYSSYELFALVDELSFEFLLLTFVPTFLHLPRWHEEDLQELRHAYWWFPGVHFHSDRWGWEQTARLLQVSVHIHPLSSVIPKPVTGASS
jgi:hypothetical protein